MIRRFKMLGAALCALCSLCAVIASTAAAVSYTASSYPTTLTGESAKGNDTITTEAGTIECKVHFEATLTEASTQLTVKTKYTGCSAFGFLEATVSTGDCHRTWTEPTTTGGNQLHGKELHERCTGPSPMTIHAGNCKITIGEQTLGGTVHITNTAAGDMTTRTAATGIAYTVTQDGFLCPFNGTGAKTGATHTQHNPITFDSTNGANVHAG
ncbi:MAG TPA: hypothetical protein VLI94_13520 [Solirubrobacterales bacterium]|nr:hypothetical protein [Solirubrobacterales bacterium]